MKYSGLGYYGIVATIIISGVCGVFSGVSLLFNALIVVGIIMAIVPVIFLLISFLLNYVCGVRVLRGRDAFKYACDIYSTAAKHGGYLYASHVFQLRVKCEEDMAVKSLNGSCRKKLFYKRFLVFPDGYREKLWVDSLFSIRTDALNVKLYVWDRVHPFFSRAFLNIIPRFNFLVYKSNNGRVCKSLIGLEISRSRKTVMNKGRNFAMCFSSRRVADAVIEYFNIYTENPNVRCIPESGVYLEAKNRCPFNDREQAILYEVLNSAYMDEEVVHVGVFGSAAKRLNSVISLNGGDLCSDIDLFVVVDSDVDGFKERLANVLSRLDIKYEIVWGDDERYFYNFRNDRVVVDIEVFPVGSMFYKTHSLLGYSIFDCYQSVYSSNGSQLDLLIHVPTKPLDMKQRASCFVEGRKSISEFCEILSRDVSGNISLIRVLNINICNYCWVLTGIRPASVLEGVDYLFGNKLIDVNEKNRIVTIVGMNEGEVKSKYFDLKEFVLRLLLEIKRESKMLYFDIDELCDKYDLASSINDWSDKVRRKNCISDEISNAIVSTGESFWSFVDSKRGGALAGLAVAVAKQPSDDSLMILKSIVDRTERLHVVYKVVESIDLLVGSDFVSVGDVDLVIHLINHAKKKADASLSRRIACAEKKIAAKFNKYDH